MAKRQNVYCKLSGMITEADAKDGRRKDFSRTSMVLGHSVEAPDVRMDWPVMLLAGDYALVRHGEQRDRQTVEGGAGKDYGRDGGRGLPLKGGPR
jgi:hypothetical protein